MIWTQEAMTAAAARERFGAIATPDPNAEVADDWVAIICHREVDGETVVAWTSYAPADISLAERVAEGTILVT